MKLRSMTQLGLALVAAVGSAFVSSSAGATSLATPTNVQVTVNTWHTFYFGGEDIFVCAPTGCDAEQPGFTNGSVGNANSVLNISFTFPQAVTPGTTITVSAPNPPTPPDVPSSAPWGTDFSTATQEYLFAGVGHSAIFSRVQVLNGGNQIRLTLGNSNSPNSGDSSYVAGQPLSLFIGGVTNPTAGTYPASDYSVTVGGSGYAAIGTQASGNPLTFGTDSAPDSSKSSLTPSGATPIAATATGSPSAGVQLIATARDRFYNAMSAVPITIAPYNGNAACSGIGSSVPDSPSSTGIANTGTSGTVSFHVFDEQASPQGVDDCFAAYFINGASPSNDIGSDSLGNGLSIARVHVGAALPVAPASFAPSGSFLLVAPPNAPSSCRRVSTARTATAPALVGTTAGCTARVTVHFADEFGNADVNHAVILQQVINSNDPSQSVRLRSLAIQGVVNGTSCLSGGAAVVPGATCTDASGNVDFLVTSTNVGSVELSPIDETAGESFAFDGTTGLLANAVGITFTPGTVSGAQSSFSFGGANAATVLASSSQSNVLTMTLKDQFGNPVSGVTTCLKINALPGCAQTGTSNGDGVSTFSVSDNTVQADTYTGYAMVNSSYLQVGQAVVITYVAGSVSAAQSTVTVSPNASVVGDGYGVATVTVSPFDAQGHPLSGLGATTTLETGGSPSLSVVNLSAGTPAAVLTFEVRSTTAGDVNLPVTINGVTISSHAVIHFVKVPKNVTVTASPSAPLANNTSNVSITATLRDADGAAVVGLQVATDPGMCPSPGNGGSPIGVSSINGTVSTQVGSANAGPVTYRLYNCGDNGRLLGSVTVTYLAVPDEAHQSTLTVNRVAAYTYRSGSSDTQDLTATVIIRNGAGTPLAGRVVSLTSSGSSLLNGATAPQSVTTDSSGVARFTVTDTEAESVVLSARDVTASPPVDLATTQTVMFALRSDEASTSTVIPNATVVSADATSAVTIVVHLVNHSSPVVGSLVSLRQGTGHAVIASSNPVSGADGTVSFTLTDAVPEAIVLQATDVTTGTLLEAVPVVHFTVPAGGSIVPTITAVNPNQGPGSGGSLVQLLGTNFSSVTKITFGGARVLTYSILSSSEIDVVVPEAILAGSVDITVTTPNGSSAPSPSDVYTYTSQPPMHVQGLSPSWMLVAGGKQVTLHGQHLTQLVKLSVNGAVVPFSVNPVGGTVSFEAPRQAHAGLVPVVLVGRSSTTSTILDFVQPTDPPTTVPPVQTQAQLAVVLSAQAATQAHGVLSVSIAGRALNGVHTVSLNGVRATHVVANRDGSMVHCSVALGAAPKGAAILSLTFSDGSSRSLALNVQAKVHGTTMFSTQDEHPKVQPKFSRVLRAEVRAR